MSSNEGAPVSRSALVIVIAVVLAASVGCARRTRPSPEATTLAPASAAAIPANFTGVKRRLAVIRLENKVKSPLPDSSWQIGEGLTEMLVSELLKTGRYTMVERAALAEVVKEQELGQTGLVQKDTATKVGELLGAQLLIAGAVTEFEATAGGGGFGIGFAGIGLGLRGNFAHVAVDIRLVDSTTGEIMKSHNASAKADATAIGIQGTTRTGIQLGSDAFKNTPLGQATREALAKAVAFITTESNIMQWTARVVQVKDGEVYINAGQNMNLRAGLALEAYNKGEELRDPGTGRSLGSKDTLAGTVTLTQIEERFSIGKFNGKGALKRGDILKLK